MWCIGCLTIFTLERPHAGHVDIGHVCDITEVIGQYKTPAEIELHSISAVLATDVADETNNFASESSCNVRAEHVPMLRLLFALLMKK